VTISTWFPVAATIANITNASPGVVTTTADHGYLDGLYVRLNISSFGMSQVNGNVYLITVLSPTTFSIGIDTTSFEPFVPASSNAISAITNANPMVVTVGANNFYKGQEVCIEGVTGMTLTEDGFTSYINGKILPILNVTSTTISFNLDTTQYSAYVSGGTVSTIAVPQVIPVGEVALTLKMAEKNVS
jgi:hypothetical protein